jgi:hypothetical protein
MNEIEEKEGRERSSILSSKERENVWSNYIAI